MHWADEVAIVTGASSGIGLAPATILHQRGVRVALVARSKRPEPGPVGHIKREGDGP